MNGYAFGALVLATAAVIISAIGAHHAYKTRKLEVERIGWIAKIIETSTAGIKIRDACADPYCAGAGFLHSHYVSVPQRQRDGPQDPVDVGSTPTGDTNDVPTTMLRRTDFDATQDLTEHILSLRKRDDEAQL